MSKQAAPEIIRMDSAALEIFSGCGSGSGAGLIGDAGSTAWTKSAGSNTAGGMVAEERSGPGARQANVSPILQAKIVGFENQPERDGEECEARDYDGRVVEAGAIGESEGCSIRDHD